MTSDPPRYVDDPVIRELQFKVVNKEANIKKWPDIVKRGDPVSYICNTKEFNNLKDQAKYI